jgi:hypothetical protein
MNFSDYFIKGLRNTLKFKNGLNLSFKGTELQIPKPTVIDTWFVGEFSTATYDIIAEYSHDDVEHVTLEVTTRVGQVSIVDHGRTNLGRDLIKFSAVIDNSKVDVIATPYYQDDGITPLVNVKLTFKATYSERIIPSSIPTTVGQTSNTGGQLGIGKNYVGSNLANGFLAFDDEGLIAISNFTKVSSPSQSTLTAAFILDSLNIQNTDATIGLITNDVSNTLALTLNSLKGLTVTSSFTANVAVSSALNNVIIGATTPVAATFTTPVVTGAVNLNPFNVNVTAAPTGTGTVTIRPAVAGTIDNMQIGNLIEKTAVFSALDVTVSGTSTQELINRQSIIPKILIGAI